MADGVETRARRSKLAMILNIVEQLQADRSLPIDPDDLSPHLELPGEDPAATPETLPEPDARDTGVGRSLWDRPSRSEQAHDLCGLVVLDVGDGIAIIAAAPREFGMAARGGNAVRAGRKIEMIEFSRDAIFDFGHCAHAPLHEPEHKQTLTHL